MTDDRHLDRRRASRRQGCIALAALVVLAAAAGAILAPAAARAALAMEAPWPSGKPGADVVETEVSFPSRSPFTLAQVEEAPVAEARARYVAPAGAGPGSALPAVVLLHGASGVRDFREGVYARQLARQGVAALILDVFGARRDLATGFTDRLIHITETMMLADAYAGLDWLAGRPEIDGDRIAVMGFSYGGMASLVAAYRQVAETLAPDGPRFAAHVAFYGPCIARFEDTATTGAPVLMLWGGRDEIVDEMRCREIAADQRGGGSPVEITVFPDAVHQWDGGRTHAWRAPRGLAGCRFTVTPDGAIHDERTPLPMLGPKTRMAMLAACSDRDGYLIQSNETIRALSNAVVARFLDPLLFPPG